MSGVLVLHAWWGLNDDVRAYAAHLADAGFATETPDLYGEGRIATDRDGATRLMKAHDASYAQAQVDAAADRLARRGPFAVLGWSFGAGMAWDVVLRRPGTAAALVAYYGLGELDPKRPVPPVLGHFAETDEFDPVENVRAFEGELRQAGHAPEFHVYARTRHWFDEPGRPEYDAKASALAWERTLAFLRRHLGDP